MTSAGVAPSGRRAGPTFGVVVLNWNNADDTIACLDALFATTPPPDHVVVVDNGSEDDSLSRIKSWKASFDARGPDAIGRAHVIAAGKNMGFAGGTNLGIKWLMDETDVSHIMLLNNDATPSSSFFADAADSLVQVGRDCVLGPTIFEDPERDKLWYAGAVEIPIRALVQHTVLRPQSSAPQQTDFVSGCAMVISRGVIDKIGVLSERFYPAYFEDGDFCHRAKKAGFPLIYAPTPVAYHKVGATVRAAKLENLLVYHKNRLRVVYVRRNYTDVRKIAALTYLAVTKPARFLVEVLTGHPRHGWAVLSGASSGFLTRDIRDK